MKTVSSTLLLAVFLVGCSRSGVELRSLADEPITNIELRVAGNELTIDRLEPRDSLRIGYSTKTEDSLSITFTIHGEQKKCSNKSYVSPPFDDEFTVSISAGGNCSIHHRVVD